MGVGWGKGEDETRRKGWTAGVEDRGRRGNGRGRWGNGRRRWGNGKDSIDNRLVVGGLGGQVVLAES
jgi:hypothetical protein